MINKEFLTLPQSMRLDIAKDYHTDETQFVNKLLNEARLSSQTIENIQNRARQLVISVRKRRLGKGGLDAFLFEYDLSSEEGIALMCMAEALLRIPDAVTIDRLIKDKITMGDWQQHIGQSSSAFVNAATWALMLTGKMIGGEKTKAANLWDVVKRLAQRSGEPVIRQAIQQAMKILGKQFVMGTTIEEAIKRAREAEDKGYRYSYDMLGEAACTQEDAMVYFDNYQKAIDAIGKVSDGKGPIKGPGISVKLSALHPRYEWSKKERLIKELLPRVKKLVQLAKGWNINFTIDAEEATRLDISLDIIEALMADPLLDGWQGFGLAVQAYQKRAGAIIDYIVDLARKNQRQIMIRLVKGAYWDSEVKWCQVEGLKDYPVFTRKASTDVSYIACIKKLLAAKDVVYSQFATHNAFTVATVIELAGNDTHYEFQCLHGMGDTLYANVIGKDYFNVSCRIYAPVGGHDTLLAYLVRRLLENGANTSFVNRIIDERAPINDLIADPMSKVQAWEEKAHPAIPLPENLYGTARPNAKGLDLSNIIECQKLLHDMEPYFKKTWIAEPTLIAKISDSLEKIPVVSPQCKSRTLGHVTLASSNCVTLAIESAQMAFEQWSKTSVEVRATCLEKMAYLLEENQTELIVLLVLEAGKTIPDAIAEIREAIDFCWYYGKQALVHFQVKTLTGPTGETNQLQLHGRGVISCISPWNFPLAIFIGQITSALAAGNAVIAKPASQTPLIGAKAIELLHKAGVPKDAVQLLPGRGSTVGQALVEHPLIAGVMFTGSTQTAKGINQSLAARSGAIVPFIAETGGQNAMIVDSSALAEQVVIDVIQSAFGCAGQRCSALRVLYLQEDVADQMINLLKGAMAELAIGDPLALATDIGPVIDQGALDVLQQHGLLMKEKAVLLKQVEVDRKIAEQGYFFAPMAVEISSISDLKDEVFGPILHVVRYQADKLDEAIDAINNTGYGLTLGIHSRIDETVQYIIDRAKVGNIYVNRNVVGAVVGVQPFGGEGLSGTGPKAGGPHYLQRLAVERTVSINTAAAGGNASLMALED